MRYLGRKSGEMTPLRRLNALQYIDGKVYAFWGDGGVLVVCVCVFACVRVMVCGWVGQGACA